MTADTTGGVAPVIGVLVRLKLRILVNRFRRSTWQVVALVLALLYGAGLTLLGIAALTGLRFAPLDVARTAVVLGGAVVVLAFLVVPLVLGVDDTLDPRRFALLGVDSTRLAAGLLVAGAVGVPGAVLALVGLATAVTWSRSPGAALLALLCVPVTVLLCVLLSRIAAGAASLLLATRRARETVSGLAVVLLVVAGPLAVLLTNLHYGPRTLRLLQRAAEALAWTPLGATWAAPASAAQGSPAAAVAQLLIGVLAVALLALVWRALVARMLTSPARHGRPQQVAGLGWFGRLPATPLGAVAARSLVYWSRDVRYRVSALIIPITPAALVVLLAFAGLPTAALALIPVPVVALFAGWTSHNDVAYDSTAIWLHVAAGVRGRADRLGRLVPVLAVAVPLVVAGSVVSGVVAGDPAVALALTGVGLCLLLTGAGLGGITSAVLPYPVPRPGDSPFQQPNASGGLAAVVQSLLFAAQLLAAAPAALLGLQGLRTGEEGWYWASLAVGLVVGVIVLQAGTSVGGRLLERRGPELLAAALRS